MAPLQILPTDSLSSSTPLGNAKVSDLINEATRAWNNAMVRQLFSSEEADLVLSIPLSQSLPMDRIVWNGTSKGKFSVCSAYHSIREMGKNIKEECSDDSEMKHLWKSIWKLKLPNKIRSFMWRACREALATKANLKKRKITKDDLCSQCGKGAETSLHLFWFCDKAKEVWCNSKMALPFSLDHSWSFIDVMWQLVKHSSTSPGLMEKMMSLCWEIWKERNSVRNGSGKRESKVLVRNAASLVEEYNAANERVVFKNPEFSTKWHPPDSPRFKMNVDAAVFSDLRAMGAGMVIRDSQGQVLAAMCKRIPANLSALDAEAKSMEIAVHFVWEMGFREVYFKTDSSNLKNILTGLSEAPASLEPITASILAQLDKFRFISFCHVKRDGNRPGHILAKFAKQVGDSVVWLEETPNLIENACSQDVSLCNFGDL